jgi:hypothetical protein
MYLSFNAKTADRLANSLTLMIKKDNITVIYILLR